MRRGRAHARQQKHHLLLGVTLFLLVALIVIGAATYFLTREPELDKVTLCPAKGPTGHVVLLVDKTDPLNFTQKQAFQASLEALVTRGVPARNLLSVFVVGGDYTANAVPVFELCNPGDGTGKSEFTDNIVRLKNQFEQRFREPMLKLSEELQAKQPAKLSPIFEMMQLVSINGFHKSNVDGPRRLIIFSDMMHNTPQFSMYDDYIDFRSFAESSYGRKVTTDLKGVNVELQYIINAPQLQTRRHLKFWEDYFSTNGAHVVAVRPLEG